MCCVWTVDGQDTPHTRPRSAASILNHVVAILCRDGEDRVICELITTKGPENSGKLLWEVAIHLAAQSGGTVSGYSCVG